MPALRDLDAPYLGAYDRLRRYRPSGFGDAEPIRFETIAAWYARFGWGDEGIFVALVEACDDAFLGWHQERKVVSNG